MDHHCGDTPRFVLGAQQQLFLVGDQSGPASNKPHVAETELAIDEYDQHSAEPGGEGPVDEEHVAGADTHADEGLGGHAQHECGRRVPHQLPIERDRPEVVVLRRVGK